MTDQSEGLEQQVVCKHNQTGYCKYGSQCHQFHINSICKENICRDKTCKERHPRTCRYFARDSICKRQDKCAYAHIEHKHQTHVQKLEEEVKTLKEEVQNITEHIKKMMQYINKDIKEIKEQQHHFTNNLSEMMVKIIDLEDEKKPEQKPETSIHQYEFHCEQCDYKCSKEVTLKKHKNTIHPIPITQTAQGTSNNLKCVVCEDIFETWNNFNIHLGEHLDEIKDLEVKDLLNGQETFKCNKCEYMSRNHNDIKMHLIEHVNQSLPTDAEETDNNEIENIDLAKTKDTTNAENKTNDYAAFKIILSKYGDDGRPLKEDSDDE